MSANNQPGQPIPLERLRSLAVGNLADELQQLPPEDMPLLGEHPLYQALDVFDFIEDLLTLKCPYLKEYLERTQDYIPLVSKPFYLRVFNPRGDLIVCHVGLGTTTTDYGGINIFGAVSHDILRERWDKGDTREIKKLARMSHRQIIERLIKGLP